MNVSLRKRLFVWLSAAIIVAGMLAATLSFVLAFEDANELQDAQLQQVASLLAADTLLPPSSRVRPMSEEEAEMHFVVRVLGAPAVDPDPALDLQLSLALRPGLQTLERSGVQWRAMVSQDAAGKRFAVAQRMTVREEVARAAGLFTLLPLLALIPALLLGISFVLRQAFAPMKALSAQVDRLDENQLEPLDQRGVPLETLPLLRAMNRLMARLTTAMDQQRRFVADAAHELRTPVAALLVQAHNVDYVELSDRARDRMTALQQGLARMSSLLDQLLAFAHLQGVRSPAKQSLQLNTVVRSVIEDALPMAQSKHVDLGCIRMEPVDVSGDPLQLHLLVRNAVDNAVRYTPSGGSVDVSVTRSGNDAYFVVEDSGPGISSEHIERVFEPFVRVLGTEQSGSGLGLAIAQIAAQALGGRIELGGRTDGQPGLRFTFRMSASQ